MTEQELNELQKSYTKGVLANMIKVDMLSSFPEPYASCKAACLEECLSS